MHQKKLLTIAFQERCRNLITRVKYS